MIATDKWEWLSITFVNENAYHLGIAITGSGCLSRGKPINGKKICNFRENSYPQEESYPQVGGGGSILTNQLKIQKLPQAGSCNIYMYSTRL